MSNFKVEFTSHSKKELKKLPKSIISQVIKKLKFISKSGDPLSYAKYIVGTKLVLYRLRVGDYRVIFTFNQKVITIAKVGHRKEIYKK